MNAGRIGVWIGAAIVIAAVFQVWFVFNGFLETSQGGVPWGGSLVIYAEPRGIALIALSLLAAVLAVVVPPLRGRAALWSSIVGILIAIGTILIYLSIQSEVSTPEHFTPSRTEIGFGVFISLLGAVIIVISGLLPSRLPASNQ